MGEVEVLQIKAMDMVVMEVVIRAIQQVLMVRMVLCISGMLLHQLHQFLEQFLFI
jgi:hypothetical protein